ncbi:MAG: polymerase sigma factor, partial [Symbiobacteriaceae bacterium]|nr:polymerase sigma factor [Symbiobacteriaceae bacterium]
LAVAQLWQQYAQRLFYYLYRLTGNKETAEDLTQETYVRALQYERRRAGRVDPATAKAWLFEIATNLAADHFRRSRLVRWLPFFGEQHGGVASDVSELLAEQELVTLALRRLPPETASLLLLRDAEAFSVPELAAMFGMNYEAVRKRLARGRDTFREEYLRLKGGAS